MALDQLNPFHEAEEASLIQINLAVLVHIHVAEGKSAQLDQRARRPMIMPKSPMRLTMKALLAAVERSSARRRSRSGSRSRCRPAPRNEDHGDVPRQDQAQQEKQNSDRY